MEDTGTAKSATSRSLIGFIDLLGFRTALFDARPETQQIILHALEEVAAENQNFEITTDHGHEGAQTTSLKPAFTSFSDHLLISFELAGLDPGGTYLALMGIRNTGCALAHRAREFGCLIRGAVTVGELYHKNRVAFGSGLVEAYELESHVAHFPRIIVAPSVLQLFPALASDDGLSTNDRTMFRDADGYWCLDYMTAYLEYLGTDVSAVACTSRRAWALTTRAKAWEQASQLANNPRAAQNWAWFAERFERSMLSVNPLRFDVNGAPLDFP